MSHILSPRFVAALLALLVFATSAPAGADDGSVYDLGHQPAPTVTGAAMVNTLTEFVEAFPLRVTGSPAEIQAGNWIEDRVSAFGYETEIVDFPVTGALPATGPIRAVTAFKQGTDLADQVMLFIGHFDTLPQSIEGAYDNGSGTTMLLGLAEAFAQVDTRRSIMFAWYNGEEEGALGSSRHVTALKNQGVKIEAVLGFDMVGIAYPVASPTATTCLCMWHGGNDSHLAPIMEAVNHEFLAFPDDPGTVTVVGNNNRNSDERSFESAGAATMRWAGLRTASAYPAYHAPDDTMDMIYSVAGGRENFEMGMENTLHSAYYTALAVDTFDDLGSSF